MFSAQFLIRGKSLNTICCIVCLNDPAIVISHTNFTINFYPFNMAWQRELMWLMMILPMQVIHFTWNIYWRMRKMLSTLDSIWYATSMSNMNEHIYHIIDLDIMETSFVKYVARWPLTPAHESNQYYYESNISIYNVDCKYSFFFLGWIKHNLWMNIIDVRDMRVEAAKPIRMASVMRTSA